MDRLTIQTLAECVAAVAAAYGGSLVALGAKVPGTMEYLVRAVLDGDAVGMIGLAAGLLVAPVRFVGIFDFQIAIPADVHVLSIS